MQGALDVLKQFCQQDLPEEQLMGFLREIAPVLIALLNRPEVSPADRETKSKLKSNRLHRLCNRLRLSSSENPSTRFITSRTNTLKKRNVLSRKSSPSGSVTCDNRSSRLISERPSQRIQRKLGNCSKSGIQSSRSVADNSERWFAADSAFRVIDTHPNGVRLPSLHRGPRWRVHPDCSPAPPRLDALLPSILRFQC
jgi:hypothetical protein